MPAQNVRWMKSDMAEGINPSWCDATVWHTALVSSREPVSGLELSVWLHRGTCCPTKMGLFLLDKWGWNKCMLCQLKCKCTSLSLNRGTLMNSDQVERSSGLVNVMLYSPKNEVLHEISFFHSLPCWCRASTAQIISEFTGWLIIFQLLQWEDLLCFSL